MMLHLGPGQEAVPENNMVGIENNPYLSLQFFFRICKAFTITDLTGLE